MLQNLELKGVEYNYIFIWHFAKWDRKFLNKFFLMSNSYTVLGSS